MSQRECLPDRRHSWTQKLHVQGQTIYLGCGLYTDGRLGEIFIDVSKAGSDLRMTMHALAMTFSVSLQHGTPLRLLVDCLKSGHINSDYACILGAVAGVLEEEFLRPVQPPPSEKAAGVYEAKSGV